MPLPRRTRPCFVPTFLFGLVMASLRLSAMSVLPPTFDELVDKSSDIVRGTVTSTESFETTSANGTPLIKTRVTWKLDRTLKGAEEDSLVLEFVGGQVGEKRLNVPGMPHFAVGDTDYVFVGKNRHALCPLVAAGHGRYHVAAQGEAVLREDGTPLSSTSDVSRALSEVNPKITTTTGAMTAQSFEASILNRVQQSRAAGQIEGGTQP